MIKDDSIYIEHMLQSIQKIEEYIGGVTYLEFIKNEEKHSTIPWRAIAGMRDKLIHDYFEVDYETIWETVQQDIPVLKAQLLEI